MLYIMTGCIGLMLGCLIGAIREGDDTAAYMFLSMLVIDIFLVVLMVVTR